MAPRQNAGGLPQWIRAEAFASDTQQLSGMRNGEAADGKAACVGAVAAADTHIIIVVIIRFITPSKARTFVAQ